MPAPVRQLRQHGLAVGFPMQTADGKIIFAVGNFTLTADQLLELLERGELHAEGVRRLVEGSKSSRAGGGSKLVHNHLFRSAAIWENWSRAACKSSAISAAITSGSGRFEESSRLSSFSQKMSRFTLSRLRSSS